MRVFNQDKSKTGIIFIASIAVFVLALLWGLLLTKSLAVASAFSVGLFYLLVVFAKFSWIISAFLLTSALGPLLNIPVTSDGLQLALAILFSGFFCLVLKLIYMKDSSVFAVPLKNPQNILLLLFLLVMVVSLINSANIFLSLQHIKRFIYCLMIYFFITFSITDEEQLKRAFLFILLGYLLVALFGIGEAVSGRRIYEVLGQRSLFGSNVPEAVTSISEKGRLQGVMGNAEFHSYRMLSFFLFLLYPFFTAPGKITKVIIFIMMLLSITNIIGAAYRGAMIAFIASLLFYFIFARYRFKWLVFSFLTIVFVCGGLFLYIMLPNLNIERLSKTEGKAVDTVHMRKNNVLVGVKMAMEHPIIGHGPDGFVIQYSRFIRDMPRMRKAELKPHNTYIQILVEYGSIGFCIFLALLVIIFRNLYSVLSNQDGKPHWFILSLISVYAAHLILMGGGNLLLDHNFWIVISLAGVVKRVYG